MSILFSYVSTEEQDLHDSVHTPDVVPQNVKLTVDIYCGAYAQAVPGYQFYCYDYLTGLYHFCVGRDDWWYQCWDGQEWEWGNYLEHDGTVDNSLLTSLDTDGLAGTSASILVVENHGRFDSVHSSEIAHGVAIQPADLSVVTSHCDDDVHVQDAVDDEDSTWMADLEDEQDDIFDVKHAYNNNQRDWSPDHSVEDEFGYYGNSKLNHQQVNNQKENHKWSSQEINEFYRTHSKTQTHSTH